MTVGERLKTALDGRVWGGMAGHVQNMSGLVQVMCMWDDQAQVIQIGDCDSRDSRPVFVSGREFEPDPSDAGTLGALQYRAIPYAWRSGKSRVAVEVLRTHVVHSADMLPAVVVRVLVWADTWRSIYDGEPTVDLGEALTECLEAAAR